MCFNKNCLNCVFCVRRKEYFIFNRLHSENSKWINKEYNLSKNEINKIKNNNFSFLGEEKKNQDKWVKEYEENDKKLKEKNKLLWENNPLSNLLGKDLINNMNNFNNNLNILNNSYPNREKFNMSEYPEAPDNDYLMCWKGQWNFKDKISNNIKLKNYKCPFYYNIKNKGIKTLEACEEELKESKNIRLAWKPALIVMIIPVILNYGCDKISDNKKNKKDVYQKQIEELNKIQIPNININIKEDN